MISTTDLLFEGAVVGASEVSTRAHALAAGLALAPGDRVALMLQNVPQMAIAVHAVWLAGGIVTTVNPMLKERELRHQLDDSGARVLLDDVAAIDALIDAHLGARVPVVDAAPDAPALLTYTSGTTGPPKGAINTHGAVRHNAGVMRDWFSLGPDDVVVALAPLFHITGLVCHLATAMVSGAPLLLTGRFEARAMLDAIERRRGTFAIGPLTAYIAMLDALDGHDLSSLTKVASGGAPVSPAVVARWQAATGTMIHNTYGLTETCAPSHLTPFGVAGPVDPAHGALSVGVPVAESRIVSLEDGVSELGPGEIGEIVTRGPAVSTAYWRRPEPLLRDGWLHTGDVGMRDADGWFYLVDRIKDMIIASGYKVWPRDVEDALFRHPAVTDCAVVGVPDEYRGETVRAFVVADGATEDELIAHCRSELAVYKAPRSVVFVAEIPRTASGKALRRELREVPLRSA